jgi:hypothetical protein
MSHTHGMIFQDKKYFQYLILNKASINTISGSSNLILRLWKSEFHIVKRKKERKKKVLTMFCILLNLEEKI